ncbi:MAG TPA: hypothetical protein PLE32_24305, partial [Haliscomenobacter sp.]|nr:hypothetical protein [Haliscomenobacter sp.]
VNGSAKYAIDVRLPGMVYGVISRSPVNGAKPSLLNATEIRKITGVIEVVTLDHGIGVVADTLEKALKAKAALRIEWSKGAKAATHSSEQAYAEYTALVNDDSRKGRSLESKGDPANAIKMATKVYTAMYKTITSTTLKWSRSMPWFRLPSMAPARRYGAAPRRRIVPKGPQPGYLASMNRK